MTAAGTLFCDFEGVSQTPCCGGSRPPRAAGPLSAVTAGWGHSSVRASPSLCCPRPAPEEGPGPGRPRPRHHPPRSSLEPAAGPWVPGLVWARSHDETPTPRSSGVPSCTPSPLVPSCAHAGPGSALGPWRWEPLRPVLTHAVASSRPPSAGPGLWQSGLADLCTDQTQKATSRRVDTRQHPPLPGCCLLGAQGAREKGPAPRRAALTRGAGRLPAGRTH